MESRARVSGNAPSLIYRYGGIGPPYVRRFIFHILCVEGRGLTGSRRSFGREGMFKL